MELYTPPEHQIGCLSIYYTFDNYYIWVGSFTSKDKYFFYIDEHTMR